MMLHDHGAQKGAQKGVRPAETRTIALGDTERVSSLTVGAPPDPAVNPDLDRVPQPLLGQRLDDGAGVSLQLQRGLSIVMQTVGHKQILHVGIAAVGHGSP